MKCTFWNLIVALTVSLSGAIPGRAQYCTVFFSMTNSARHVIGEVNTECPPSWHSATWDNWGVSSNFCGVWDGDQFRGFHPEGSQGQWNSCTRDHIRDTDLVYYNHDHNGNLWGDDQWQDGEYRYCDSSSDIYTDCPIDTDGDGVCDAGGCLPLTSRGFGVNNQFLTQYGLDWPDPDDFITTLYVDSGCCHASLSCTKDNCWGPAYSPWYPANDPLPETNIHANVRLVVHYAFFTDYYGECDLRRRTDPRYDCY